MIIVHNAYKYISNQFENCKNIKDFDELENNFENFCNEQKETPPPFRDIFELSNEYLFNKKFNEKFDELKLNEKNPFDNGYGNLMDNSTLVNNDIDCNDIHNIDNSIDYNPNDLNNTKITINFNNSVIKYEEPIPLPDTYGNCYRFGIDSIKDFTEYNDNFILTDYTIAFSKPDEIVHNKKNITFEELVKERETFDNLIYNNI